MNICLSVKLERQQPGVHQTDYTNMADLARLESEQLSLRNRSGIRNRKAKGLHPGSKVNSVVTREKVPGRYKEFIKNEDWKVL
jgi:hypothetical protein